MLCIQRTRIMMNRIGSPCRLLIITCLLYTSIIAAGAAINPAISNVWTFVILAVGPFNILKGVIVSLLTALVYKRVSVIIHSDSGRRAVKAS